MVLASDNPWSFGWDQVFALLNFLAVVIGIWVARQSFQRWQDEKIASRQIEIAEEVLAETYEAESVFDDIRSPWSSSSEGKSRTKDAADLPFETDNEKNRKDRNYVPFERLERHRDFWERLFKTRVLVKAYFGTEAQEEFDQLFKLRQTFVAAANEKAIFSDGLADGPEGVDRTLYLKHVRDAEKILWKIKSGNEDEFSLQLFQATKKIERTMLPLIQRKRSRLK